MTASSEIIIYVPGMKPKPPAKDHRAMLWTSLVDGVRRADEGQAAALGSRPDILRLAAWSTLFYDEQTSVTPDLPGIRRLLRLDGPEPADIDEIGDWRRRVQQLVYRLGDTFPVLIHMVANPAMQANLEDARRYFSDDGGCATAIRQLVAAELRRASESGARIMLIGHSLGSVIAFDTLWELSRRAGSEIRVDEFVSVGSPLGLNFVRNRLLGADEPASRRYPDNIGGWTNLSAVGDMTALGVPMHAEYSPMLEQGLLSHIDDQIDLHTYFRGPDGLNVHKCYGYMANIVTGRVIAKWLSRQPGVRANQGLAE